MVQTGGLYFTGSRYALPNDPSVKFDHITEILQYNARLGHGNYFIKENADASEKAAYIRLVNYAFCPGRDFDHCRTRQLNRYEIQACLSGMFHFKLDTTDGCWHDTWGCSRGENLKSSYDSLPALLRDLRGIQNLEGSIEGRKRKPIGQEANEFHKKERLIMAFRLSIADDAVIDNLTVNEPPHLALPTKLPATKKQKLSKAKATAAPRNKASGGQSSSGFSSEDDLVDRKYTKKGDDAAQQHRGKKHAMPSSYRSESAKKRDLEEALAQRTEQSIKDNTLTVFNDRSEPYDEILLMVNVPDHKWSIARDLSISYGGGTYCISDRYGVKYSQNSLANCTSTDAVFKRLGTYGGYDLGDVDEEFREAARLEIARANVTGKRSQWASYRMLEDHEGITLLHTLGFQRPQSESNEWVVPNRLLQYVNPYLEGEPRLLKERYATTDALRVALRSIPDLEFHPDGGRRRNREATLNTDVMIALRLWIACGPKGPDACRYDVNPKSCPPSPDCRSLASQDQEEHIVSPTRHEDLLTQPTTPENDDALFQDAIADFAEKTPEKEDFEFESPNRGLLTQAPTDED